ncbi:MAG: tetratricopeptide repeat protein [Acidobacteriota bacterium]
MRPSHSLTLLAAACLLSACMSGKQPATLQSLATQEFNVKPDEVEVVSEAQAIKAYSQLLDSAPHSAQGAEALRRLADLEMDRADKASADAAGTPDYRAAIARYQETLTNHPDAPNRDQVLYQLARAQEQAGDLEAALKSLNQLVQAHPHTVYIDEAQFRRGELAFSASQYADAENAYAALLSADSANPYRDRARFMLGWSRFKLGQFDEALQAFFGVLDVKLASRPGGNSLVSPDSLNRAERELLVDTFRGISLSLANLQGAESIAAYTTKPLRQSYAILVYEQLGDFYLKQERPKDAADAFNAFAQRFPLDVQAPKLQARVIEIYERAGFVNQAVEAKKVFVTRYGRDSAYRVSRPQPWLQAQPRVQVLLAELARYHHAKAQTSKRSEDYQEAVRWYREFLNAFPNDTHAVRNNFLLAELLFEDHRFAEAAVEYEKVAYDYPWHPQSAEAGYAALLSHAELQKKADPLDLPRLQRAAVASALRFAKAFPGNPRAGAVLSDAAEKLYALKDAEQANRVALKVLDMKPPATDAQRRVAWLVLAHTAFQRGAYFVAEQSYTRVLEMTSPQAPGYSELVENQVASAYKLGEQARAAGQFKEAAGHFTRVSKIAPQLGTRANAQFDAGAALVGAKDWAGAEAMLVDFRQRYPQHPMQPQVAPKLALAYSEQAKWAPAAVEMERLSASSKDAAVARDALWQAATFHEKAGERAAAARAYERYLAQSLAQRPLPLVSVMETRARLAGLAKEDGNLKRELALMKDIYEADLNGGAARTDRTRYLGATAALALAEPAAQAYRQVALVEPLQKQLKLKKAKLEEALNAYAKAANLGVADVSTAASYHIASLYSDFGKAIMESQRPKKLSAVELEQYNVLLEEQALPFEEKASDMHEVNARRAAAGIYDEWVQRSFDALGQMLPVRYGKRERGEGVDLAAAPADKLATTATALEQAVKYNPNQPGKLNQLGVTYRQLGRFDKARAAYEQAIAVDAHYAPAVLNLGILSDLYMGDAARAQSQYERYLSLTPQGDPTVSKWLAEIKKRKPAAAATASKEAS